MIPSLILLLNIILPFHYETYLESSKKDPIKILQNLDIHENVIINIAFGNFKFPTVEEKITIDGLEFSERDLKKVIEHVHSKKGLVKLSLGGPSYPLDPILDNFDDASELAVKIAKIVEEYRLDGIDFSIVDQANPNYEIVLIKLLRDKIPKKIISLTFQVSTQNRTTSWIIEDVKEDVSYFNFMEYNLVVTPEKNFVETVKSNILSYVDKWKIDPRQLQIGLVLGHDPKGNLLTLDQAKEIAAWVKENNYLGITTWSINRDAESSYSYSNAIMLKMLQ